jgi:hypothetical protein
MNVFLKVFGFSRISSGWLLLCFSALVFLFALRGLPGNPTAEEMMATETWRSEGPLELSPERGRFALLYSIVEDESLFFSLPVARLATPDLALNPEGKFVSLFAPFLSFILIPGYFTGKLLGASVVGAIAMIALFAAGNALFVRAIALRLGAGRNAASLGALTFLFGTPAFAYGTTLYQHHVSVFLLLFSVYALLRWNTFWSLSLVFLLIGISVPLDNPNAFLFIPIALWALARIVSVKAGESGDAFSMTARPLLLFSGLIVVVPLLLFMWYNVTVNGGVLQLSGTLPNVPAISENGLALDSDPNQHTEKKPEEREEKTAIGFFETRNILNGLYVHLVSPDRGTLRYTPVILLGIFGFVLLYRKKKFLVLNVLAGVSLVTLLLYSLWGDPWGGWAFGSRYLIPAYAMLGIGISIALEEWKKSRVFLGVFCALFVYSVGVNTLGAITSSANPPQIQVLELEALSGKEQKYTFARNWQYLHESGSKSLAYQIGMNRRMSAEAYYWFLVTLVVAGSSGFLVSLAREKNRTL